jgi:uncharacterized protein (DUF983 family)
MMTSLLDRPMRHIGRAMLRGATCRCPQCGKGRLFRAFLKVADSCPHCGEELHHQRADDAPAYFNILIVGHVVAPIALAVETAFAPSYWVHIALWGPLATAMAIGLMQPIKGTIVALQWANFMHGFNPAGDPELEPRALAVEHRG